MKQLRTIHRLAAIATAGALMSESGVSFAAQTFKTASQNVNLASGGFPGLISTLAYIGGAGLGVAGIYKIKNHVDNPGQTPLKDGVIRLGAGGMLFALPFITDAMMGSINAGNNANLQQTQLAVPAPIP